MKDDWKGFLLIICLLVIGFFIGQSCDEKETSDISPILEILEQNKKDIAKIDSNQAIISMKQDTIIKQRVLHQTFNKYEINKMDSLIGIDSNNVNAIIRARLQRLSQLSGFFYITSDSKGIRKDTTGSTGW